MNLCTPQYFDEFPSSNINSAPFIKLGFDPEISNVLDLGCGTGETCSWIHETLNLDCTGVDI